ncbi:ABC transporter ATP-binding protein [Mesorhizobium xinjiangense]|uniref:ABC transporter ATP-binding protein n=1 Tax=Mesorhizobium xinjiangense TaxID=2678685 RepID=UPI0012EDE98E|nr:ABC transporter ATP-binding protein [Mesorhizobium xinjiangense]
MLLQVSGLAYDYSGVGAVSDCSLELPRGKIAALIGGNGAGKSTSVKMIAGALRPRSGKVVLDGQDITAMPAHKTVELGIALVPEGRLVFQHLTVRENLTLSGHVRRAREKFQQNLERVFDLFPRLREREAQNAGSLSGGEQQMLAIGRGLMTRPRILILDEPSLGLSPILVSQMFLLIRKLNEEGISVLLVEQNVHHTLAIADYAYVLEKGRVVQEGEGRALLKDPKVKEAYLGLA